MNELNRAGVGQHLEIGGGAWQCDELTVDVPLSEEVKRALILHESEPRALLVQPVEAEELAERTGLLDEVGMIRDAVSMPFAIAFIRVDDWNQELSPWPAPAVFGKQDFGAGANAMLKTIESILPELKSRCNLPGDAPVVLGGYSLAALFSLWCSYQTDAFAAIGAASPSVWFPGWIDYAQGRQPLSRAVYLSLGDREEKTRNAIVSTVGSCIRRQHELLRAQGVPCTLEWNAGGHFQDPGQRTARAFLWCIDALEAERTHRYH